MSLASETHGPAEFGGRPLSLDDALARLSATTFHRWKDYEFFYLITHRRMHLFAAIPSGVKTTIQCLDIGAERFRPKRGRLAKDALAVLFPAQVMQLWTSGATLTEHPAHFDRGDGTMEWFTEPMPVVRADLRIPPATMRELLSFWKSIQNRQDVPGGVPKWVWETIHRGRTPERTADLAPMEQSRASARRMAMTRRVRPGVDPAHAYVGPVPSTQSLEPRIQWLMDHLYGAQADWFVHCGSPKKIDLEREIFTRLANDGTRGVRHAKVSMALIHKLARGWDFPSMAPHA